MRIHCPHYDGRLVRRRQLRPSLFGLLRHVLRRALTSADSDAYRYAYARTHAGTGSEPYDARALTGARRSYVAADDIAAVPVPVSAADARADEKSHTGPDALVHVRVHRPQNDGHLVREQRGRQLRPPSVLGTLRPVLCWAYAQADAGAAASADASPDARALAETDITADTVAHEETDSGAGASSVTETVVEPDAAPIHELSDSGAVAPADDSIPDTGGWQPHGGARCCTDRGPWHRRIYRHLRGDSAGLLRGL